MSVPFPGDYFLYYILHMLKLGEHVGLVEDSESNSGLIQYEYEFHCHQVVSLSRTLMPSITG